MGDSGEGLIDAQGRIQERIEELEREKLSRKQGRSVGNPELKRAVESLQLARTQLERQLKVVTSETRRTQIIEAVEELDRRLEKLVPSTKDSKTGTDITGR
jgi:hypothetical protein